MKKKLFQKLFFFDGGFYDVWNVPVFKRKDEYCRKIIGNKEIETSEEFDFNKQTIIFCKEANKISDFDIETAFLELKDLKEIFISNEILLDRFRLAVSEKEMEPFNFLVKEDEKELSDVITNKGNFKNAWHMPILNLNLFYVSEIWKHLGNIARNKK